MALGLTQLLTEKSKGEGKGGRCVGLTNVPPSCVDCLEIWEPQPPGTRWSVQACNGIALPLRFYLYDLECKNVNENLALIVCR